jgi:lysozyme family protein
MKELLEIQSELKCPKGNYNSFGKYRYRSAEQILEAVKPLLHKHNCTLTITDDIIEMGSIHVLKSTAVFSTGTGIVQVSGFAGIDYNMKGMSVPQMYGSSSSYARKYALNGLFLIDETESDPDSKDNAKDAPKAKNEVNTDLPWLNENTAEFTKVKEALKNGYSIEDVKKKYKLSQKVQELLNQ